MNLVPFWLQVPVKLVYWGALAAWLWRRYRFLWR